jgi:group I intron endonuclease
MIIYKTTNLINGKIYVGQDSKNNQKYLGSGIVLNHAIKKYGKDNFKKEILEHCIDKNDMDEKEKYWISELNSRNRNIGYNITKGGDGCLGCKFPDRVFTKEHKDNISKNHADVSGEKNPMFGKTHTNLVKQKSRLRNLGKKASDNTKSKMSEQRKGEGNSKSKLTEQQVLIIRDLYFIDGESQKILAIKFQVQDACIFKIVTYRTWKHI